MAKTGHRITKHQMKQDSFVTLAFRAQEYIQKNQKYFIGGLVALIVLVVGAWMYTSASQQAELNAEEALGEAYARIQQKDMTGAAQVYERVIAEQGGTTGAREALFYLANLYFVEKEWQKSIDAYERWAKKYGGDDPIRKAASWAAIGDAYQELGEYDKSIEYYDRAAGEKSGEFLIGQVLESAARSALLKGDTTKAKEYADELFDKKGNVPAMLDLRELLALHGVEYTRGL